MQNNKNYGIIDDEFNTKKTKQTYAPTRSKSAGLVSNQPKTLGTIDKTVDDGFYIKPPKGQSPVYGTGEKDTVKPIPLRTLEADKKITDSTNEKRKAAPDTNKDKVNQQRAEVLPAINKVYNGLQEKADKRKWDMPTEYVKKTQTFLNDFGYTDREGKALKVDGVLGAKTKIALEKHFQEKIPKQDVFDMQTLLNKNGFKDKDGNPLKTDGILGKKTDSAANKAIAKLEKSEDSIAISDQTKADTSLMSEDDRINKLIEGSKSKDAEITPASFSLTAAAAGVVAAGLADGLVTGGVYAFTGKRFGAGFINGFVEGLSTMIGTCVGGIPGTVIGSTLGSALGSLSEDLLFNRDNKSVEDIAKSAAESAAYGIVSGVGSAYLKYVIKVANEAGSVAQTLMKYDEEFGKALETFFDQIVNILSSQ